MAKRKTAAAKKKAPSKKTGIKKTVKPAKKASATTIKKSDKKPALKKKVVKKAKKKSARRKPETLMCFLTTACVDYYSLPDNGYELNTLRNYRDTYLASTQQGKKLIRDYYRVSPEIVKRVDRDAQKNSIYAYIYSQVKDACRAIENEEFLFAKKIYSAMVKTLMIKYQLA